MARHPSIFPIILLPCFPSKSQKFINFADSEEMGDIFQNKSTVSL